MARPITVEDIKLFLNDFPEANLLTRESEFSTERIQKARQYVLDEWNETSPNTNVYTVETFPYRNMMLYGIAAWLFLGQATHQARNHLTYQSGGLAISDDENAQAYLNFYNVFNGIFKQRLACKKMEENMNHGWGTEHSDYYGY